jgi:hypothetical protein
MDLSASQLSIGFNNVVVVNPTITSPTISTMVTSPLSDDDIVDNKWKVPSNYLPQTSTSTGHPPTIGEVIKPLAGQPKQLQKQTSLNAVKLGPGQLQPKGYRLTTGRYGELKMSFIAVKGILDVEVSACAPQKNESNDLRHSGHHRPKYCARQFGPTRHLRQVLHQRRRTVATQEEDSRR